MACGGTVLLLALLVGVGAGVGGAVVVALLEKKNVS